MKKLNILGIPYNYVERPGELGKGNIGASNLRASTIWVESEMPERVRLNTILHEFYHQVATHYDMREIDNNETWLDILAAATVDLIKDNPELVERISRLSSPSSRRRSKD